MTNNPDSKAPEEIFAFYAPDVEEDNPGCTIIAGERVMHGAQRYIKPSPQQAAKVLLDEIRRPATKEDKPDWRWLSRLDVPSLQALADSKEIDG